MSMNYSFWPSFSKSSLMALTLPQAGIAQPLDNLETSVFDIKYGAEDFELLFVFSNP